METGRWGEGGGRGRGGGTEEEREEERERGERELLPLLIWCLRVLQARGHPPYVTSIHLKHNKPPFFKTYAMVFIINKINTANTWNIQETFRIVRDRWAYMKLVQSMSIGALNARVQKPQVSHLYMGYFGDGFLLTIGVRFQTFKSFNNFTEMPVLEIIDLILVLVHVPCCVPITKNHWAVEVLPVSKTEFM